MHALLKEIEAVSSPVRRFGRVARIEGLLVEVTGAAGRHQPGRPGHATAGTGKEIPCEVVGFRDGRALAMPLGQLDGMALGARADFDDRPAAIYPCTAWLGRVLDAFGDPPTARVRCRRAPMAYPLSAAAACRPRARASAASSIWACARINAFTTCCKGQRMGIFSGSGVGKSTLLAMLARNTECRRHRHRPGRRTRPRAQGIHRGRSGRGGLGAFGGGRRDLGRARPGAPSGGVCRHGRRRIFPRPGLACAAADGFGHALRHGAARDRSVGRRAAGDQGLYAHGVRRIAAAAGTRRSRAPKGRPAPSPACSPFWSKATIITNRSPMRCAAFSTATSCWTVPLRNAAAFRRSTF